MKSIFKLFGKLIIVLMPLFVAWILVLKANGINITQSHVDLQATFNQVSLSFANNKFSIVEWFDSMGDIFLDADDFASIVINTPLDYLKYIFAVLWDIFDIIILPIATIGKFLGYFFEIATLLLTAFFDPVLVPNPYVPPIWR